MPSTACGADEQNDKIVQWKKTYEDKVLPIIQSRCLDCHQGEKPEGEFDLSRFTTGDAAVEAGDAWERVARRVRLNEMPPKGSPGLNDAQKRSFHRWVDSRPNQDLCRQLASDETQSWYRGHVMSRRLTRTEYRNAVRDLTGIVLLPEQEPPSDGAGGEGFDTVGDALFTSTIHLESYLAAADRVINEVLPEDLSIVTPEQRKVAERMLIALPSELDPQSTLSATEAAESNLSAFILRAWRRPAEVEEVARLRSLFDVMRSKTGVSFSGALREPMKAILVSPHFLFVVETEPGDAGVHRLTSYQLATRLALFIWSSVPDQQLLELADDGRLFDEEILRSEVLRMLQDPKARALGENFGLQWLGLQGFAQLKPDQDVFPEFNADLSDDLREEAIRFVAGVFQNDQPLTDLISSDYVYVNARLARHYGLPPLAQEDWQKVMLSDGKRGGVITLGSVLTTSSYARRTSPVLRGRWILEEVLGSPVPPPPANVPALEETNSADQATTLRQRLELHRKHQECASCHDRMDPLGFGLENFDAIGRWRDHDAGQPIDAAGILPSGESFSGPAQLKEVVLNRQHDFLRHFVNKMLGFALGRELNKFDACIVDECLKQLQQEDLRASVLIQEIALCYPFQYRYHKESDVQPEGRIQRLRKRIETFLKQQE